MAKRIPSPCRHPGCPALVEGGGYCDKHKKQEKAWKNRDYDRQRGTSAQRGYNAQWQKVRRLKLQQDPLCERCLKAGRLVAATVVHHIKPVDKYPELRLAMDNLQSLCQGCHNRIHGNHK